MFTTLFTRGPTASSCRGNGIVESTEPWGSLTALSEGQVEAERERHHNNIPTAGTGGPPKLARVFYRCVGVVYSTADALTGELLCEAKAIAAAAPPPLPRPE